MQALHDNIIELAFILLHFLVFIINYEVMKKKLMQPSVLFSFLWFVIILCHFIFRFTLLEELAPLKTSTFLILFIGVVAFSFGSFIQTTIWQKNELAGAVQVRENIRLSLPLRYFLIAIVLVALPFYIKASYKMFLASQVESFFIGLRTELLYGDEDIGPLRYMGTFSYIVLAINLVAFFKNRTKLNTFLLVTSILLSISYAILATGRLLYFMLLAIYAGIAFIFNENFSVKRILRLMAIFMIFFIFMGIIYGKGGNTESSLGQNLRPAAKVTAVYMVASLNSLNYDLNHQFSISYSGNNSLRFFTKLFQQLHIMPNANVADILQEFVLIPYPTNVYTIYNKYIRDFGKFYAWIMVFLYGFLHSYLYNKAVATRQIRFGLYYAVMLFPLLISFFDDQYISLTSMWLQIIFYIEIIVRINQYLINRKSAKAIAVYSIASGNENTNNTQ